MLKKLQSPLIASLLGLALYGVTTAMLWKPILNHAVPQQAVEPDIHKEELDLWIGKNPEIEELIAELKQGKEAMAKKEVELNELALRVQTERQELITLTQAIFRLQQDFDTNVVRIKEAEVANLKKLGKMYAEMTPEGAALIFKQLENEAAIKTMLFMKDSERAPILDILAKEGESGARKVANITEKIRLSMPPQDAKKAAK